MVSIKPGLNEKAVVLGTGQRAAAEGHSVDCFELIATPVWTAFAPTTIGRLAC